MSPSVVIVDTAWLIIYFLKILSLFTTFRAIHFKIEIYFLMNLLMSLILFIDRHQ